MNIAKPASRPKLRVGANDEVDSDRKPSPITSELVITARPQRAARP